MLPNPDEVHSQRELVAVLGLLKDRSGLTYRQLESRARRAGFRLPRSTVASTLARTTLPKEEFVTALVRACGADPATWQEAYRRVADLRPEADTGAHSVVTQPRQLPYCAPDLIGHERELSAVVDWLTSPHAQPPVTVITGPPGVGKSVLALRALRRVVAHYPDGQLYVELRCATPGAEPLPVDHVVTRLLRGLGIPPYQLPADISECTALLRSLLADRRVLGSVCGCDHQVVRVSSLSQIIEARRWRPAR
ncbi:ATP-binding protein [Streptomyces marianii]|uniref:Uncharacterized protein n=1 Tax=Streptomyces marianii TaxID=1817406 RepID=A0A5R9DZR2_9ACTN|nr:ATP-binding protein [Streptomyces marianii]TLQ43148.1 hypothetical protein FEF34_08340 [Streptomyces marianii]